MRSTRFAFTTAAAGGFILSVALAACGGSGERAENEVLIAAIFDLTGPTADVGLDYAEGVHADGGFQSRKRRPALLTGCFCRRRCGCGGAGWPC